MARLENKGRTGLPPAPAPTRRSANPWRFSETARRRAEPEESIPRELLEAFMEEARQEAPRDAGSKPAAAPAPAPAPAPVRTGRQGLRFWPLLVLIAMAAIFVRVVMGAMESGDWRQAIPALFALLFIAHGLWRARRRRDEPANDEAPDR